MSTSYPWYQTVSDGSLRQGDIFVGFPVFVPNVDSAAIDEFISGKSKVDIDGKRLEMDVIVASQSCDLENNKVKSVVICPVWSLDHIKKVFHWEDDRLENIRKGRQHSWHLVNRSDDPNAEISVVEFRRVYTTTKEILSAFTVKKGSHMRLLPPYREQFSQAFGRYFMRVALPEDIPSFEQPEAV